MMSLFLAALLAPASSATQVALASLPAAPAEDAADAPEERLECRRRREESGQIGKRARTFKVCKTAAEWKAMPRR